jgi:hypothetical protein
MSIVSHLHHLFNAETCQSSIHTLRWKDRPLQCPRCQSHNVDPWGAYHYQPGLKRYRCKEKDSKRTFNDLTGTLLDRIFPANFGERLAISESYWNISGGPRARSRLAPFGCASGHVPCRL